MVARNIMSKDVVSLSPGMSIVDAADALLHYRIHGAPVVDEADQLIGMVSFTDLSAIPRLQLGPNGLAQLLAARRALLAFFDQALRAMPSTLLRSGDVNGALLPTPN